MCPCYVVHGGRHITTTAVNAKPPLETEFRQSTSSKIQMFFWGTGNSKLSWWLRTFLMRTFWRLDLQLVSMEYELKWLRLSPFLYRTLYIICTARKGKALVVNPDILLALQGRCRLLFTNKKFNYCFHRLSLPSAFQWRQLMLIDVTSNLKCPYTHVLIHLYRTYIHKRI